MQNKRFKPHWKAVGFIIFGVVCSGFLCSLFARGPVKECTMVIGLIVIAVLIVGSLGAIIAHSQPYYATTMMSALLALVALLVLFSDKKQETITPAYPVTTVTEVKETDNTKAFIEFEKTLTKKEIIPGILVGIKKGQLTDEVLIYVNDSWHYEPKQIRLQAAQNLWNLWARIDHPDPVDKARISLRDLNNNEVGGSRIIAGSLIWVTD